MTDLTEAKRLVEEAAGGDWVLRGKATDWWLANGLPLIAAHEAALREIEALRDGRVPEGYALVPVKPTPAMNDALLAAVADATVPNPQAVAWDCLRGYRAMVEAAPARALLGDRS